MNMKTNLKIAGVAALFAVAALCNASPTNNTAALPETANSRTSLIPVAAGRVFPIWRRRRR